MVKALSSVLNKILLLLFPLHSGLNVKCNGLDESTCVDRHCHRETAMSTFFHDRVYTAWDKDT